MIKVKILFVVFMAFGISHLANAQKKYAVLITGDYAATQNSIPGSDLWNGGINKDEPEDYDEFWNDTYLMWEMLQEKGFLQENIIVLFAGGEDYSVTNPNIAARYKPVDPNCNHNRLFCKHSQCKRCFQWSG